MSTRCQVKVTQTGLSWEQSLMLYHHCDGYPEHMLACMQKALTLMYAPKDMGTWLHTNAWQAGRAGSVAAYLCHAHPAGFEPEAGFELHGDIEYFYELEVRNLKGGCVDDKPEWHVSYKDSDGNLVTQQIKPEAADGPH